MPIITFLNRRELLTTYDPCTVSKVRKILLANRIGYRVKTVNTPMGAGRNRVGFSHRQEQQIVYVHKADWEYAMYLLRNQK